MEDEAVTRFNDIVEEDGVVIQTDGLNVLIDDIGAWIASHSITLWGKAFKDFFPKARTYTKKLPFLDQAGAESAMNRVILRYFWRELVVKGAIERKDIPIRFNKWVDVSSSECIFTEYQRKQFGRPHLLQCPWYLEMKVNDGCPGEERNLKANCEQQMKQNVSEHVVLPDSPTSDVGGEDELSEKQRQKQAAKRTRLEARLKVKEDKKKEKEEELNKKKEVSARNKELAKLVAKEGPEKLLSLPGISPSGSSMPTTFTPLMSQVPFSVPPIPSQTVYTIPCSQVEDKQCGVEVINDNIKGILELFSDITLGGEPLIWSNIQEWIKAH